MSKYQRVLQYLKKYDNKKNLDKFVYEKREEGSASKSLQLLLQYTNYINNISCACRSLSFRMHATKYMGSKYSYVLYINCS